MFSSSNFENDHGEQVLRSFRPFTNRSNRVFGVNHRFGLTKGGWRVVAALSTVLISLIDGNLMRKRIYRRRMMSS